MFILANENFPLDAVEALRAAGHNVIWKRTEAPGSSDEAILARAQAENRILVTFDKDFGELVYRLGLPASCGIILFRISTPSST
jgi:predicted nuclease of predicted toxin-antitoxin system